MQRAAYGTVNMCRRYLAPVRSCLIAESIEFFRSGPMHSPHVLSWSLAVRKPLRSSSAEVVSNSSSKLIFHHPVIAINAMTWGRGRASQSPSTRHHRFSAREN
ncbi:hypothetical protein AcV5_006417 [Taiwanofungus camphoratus]|nr:hypothetical protein AcV5_006417 [Antrodia cinnamomea]